MKKKSIVLAVGGSGGHLVPAEFLAEKLKEKNPELEIYFLGGKLDKNPFFHKEKFSFLSIPAASFVKKRALFSAFFSILKGIYLASRFFYNKRPCLVIGFGSYHSFPVLVAASLFKVPKVLFEANCIPGKVNRLFARGKKSALAAQFPFQYPTKVVQVARFPWKKPAIFDRREAKKSLGFNPDLPLFFLFGGSQGATFLNDLFPQVILLLQEKKISFSLIHLTGSESETNKLQKIYCDLNIDFIVDTYSQKMELFYAAADLVIARAGAGTLSELIHYERASILVPYPYASENHQDKNGDFMVQTVQGGRKLMQKSCTPTLLYEEIKNLLQEKKLQKMEQAITDYKIKSEKGRVSLPDLVSEKLKEVSF